ncbi:uncharacterized protein [Asterias amurensis]|uniref:uncharacterized protein isoform X2 n=1 Tax=Asterias amurensis TaxID=7602 RepID=UPI003AB8B689
MLLAGCWLLDAYCWMLVLLRHLGLNQHADFIHSAVIKTVKQNKIFIGSHGQAVLQDDFDSSMQGDSNEITSVHDQNWLLSWGSYGTGCSWMSRYVAFLYHRPPNSFRIQHESCRASLDSPKAQLSA